MASSSINMYVPLARPRKTVLFNKTQHEVGRLSNRPGFVLCCAAAQESSSTATVSTDKKEAEPVKATATEATKEAAPAKPKKAPVKALPEMMLEDVIPSLKASLEAQEEISQIDLSFQDNTLEGSFLKNDIPYYFWAFFPDGVLTGPKGFSLSSHGSGPSTIEPFLVDERKITGKLIVFWIEKRLAAQGILPVWKDEELAV